MIASDLSRFQELALFEGGPFGRVLRSARLYGPELRQRAWHRAFFLVALTWLPLLLLSALQGQALDTPNRMPFLLDASVHVRFLLALPLLVLAEIGVDSCVRSAPATFVQRGLVPDAQWPLLHVAVGRALRLRDSGIAEGVMLAIVYAIAVSQSGGSYVRLDQAALDAASWHVLPAADGGARSLAGWWFTLFSLPLFQFLTLRWYYRILIWTGLTWRISRLALHLQPAHTDRAAGLGFLSRTVFAYIPLALAHGSMLSAAIVDRIFYAGATLTDFRIEIVAMFVFVFVLVLAPLVVFAPMLMAANLKATAEYDALAGGVVREFEARWIGDAVRKRRELLDVSEVSAMTDLDTTVGIVREMHYVPVTREGLLWIGAAVLAPVLPLVLTMMPAEELFKKLVGMLV